MVKPHLVKSWCIRRIDEEFLAHMEHLLDLYQQPYDACYPVICVDERPCFLIGNTIAPLDIKPGSVKKQDYVYEKLGSATLFMAVEPLSGKRWTKVYGRRRKREYADFMQYVANQYPQAQQMHIVQDNLATHTKGAFYQVLSAQEAFPLVQRLQFHFTPLHASWLNMAEIELSALSKQCLNRRIATIDELKTEIQAWTEQRNQQHIKINWQFTKEQAREKLSRHYQNVNYQNAA